MKDKELEMVIFLARLSSLECELRKGKTCSSYSTPCCLFCKYVANCYQAQKERNVECRFCSAVGFCAKIENLLRRLEWKRNESMAK
ncbi:MAG: hypothetical protein DRN81_07010 [Thermoproteota archaeon]|nr:MAG: hypothetical protein DRN81_07010 [Candidatus Korarchaeota archaeon]